MKVLVYPHSMELGGSQLNAIELAGALRDRGHDVVVYSEPGPLVAQVVALGLEHVEAPRGRSCPSPARVAHLRRVLRERGVDVVHGYEWPPILEAYAATSGLSTRTVGTVMSMAVAPFLPDSVPLVVGTERIRASCDPHRPAPVHVIEPPVDVAANRPVHRSPRGTHAAPDVPEPLEVVVVCRLVPELKLEGLLTAIDAVSDLPVDTVEGRPVRLTIVGDGAARAQVEERAAAANDRCGREVVRLLGALDDPRPAYAAADVALGMGGSALRALAFGTPLVVQGEQGFFELLDVGTLPYFLQRGFYGVGDRTSDEARAHLAGIVADLAGDPERRALLGAWGRALVVERFSLERAARLQERVYAAALAAPDAGHGRRTSAVSTAVATAGGLVAYKAEQHAGRLRGRRARDDFNARPA